MKRASLADRRTRRLFLGLWALLAGCAGEPGREGREPLRVAAAADMRDALPRLIAAYGDLDGPIAAPTFGASGNLAEQIRGGAPFDLFLSADAALPEALEREGLLVAGSTKPYARGSLVLLVHPAISVEIGSIRDLAKAEIRSIAIANPEVAPYGKAAKQALEKAGLWDALAPKVVPAGSVSEAFLHVEQGNADAALVSRSLVAKAASKVVDVDPDLYPPRIQALGVLSRSRDAGRASRFAAFVLGPEAGRILAEHGFSPPAP